MFNTIMTKNIEKALGFENYEYIIQNLQRVNVSIDENYQTKFNDYFQIRRNVNWRRNYYNFFEEIKTNNNVTFDLIIEHIYENFRTNKGNEHPVEPSFSSKMLATINPNMPIYDLKVLDKLNLSLEGKTSVEKVCDAKRIYAQICDRYFTYLDTPECNDAIVLFDQYFPDYTNISKTKKIDWFLWTLSKDDLRQIGKFNSLISV